MIIYHFLSLATQVIIALDNHFLSQATQVILALDNSLEAEFITMYRTRAIITRGLYTFYPLFEVQKRFFKGLFS